jgi:hypothetical protein
MPHDGGSPLWQPAELAKAGNFVALKPEATSLQFFDCVRTGSDYRREHPLLHVQAALCKRRLTFVVTTLSPGSELPLVACN